jgi:hypothetical protein
MRCWTKVCLNLGGGNSISSPSRSSCLPGASGRCSNSSKVSRVVVVAPTLHLNRFSARMVFPCKPRFLSGRLRSTPPGMYNHQRLRARAAAGSVNLPGAGPGRGRPVACLALADHGPYFTTDPGSIRREELYERR